MTPNHNCRVTMRRGLAMSAFLLILAAASTASAQIPPYHPSNPVAVGTNSILVWNLDQGSGTTATDSANPVLDGNNAGTLNGAGVTWTNSAKFAGGLNFAGTSAVGYVAAPITGSLLANAEVCMSAWIRPTAGAAPGGSYILGWSGPDSALAFVRVNDGGTSISAGFRLKLNGSYVWAEALASVPYNSSWSNTWHHVAGSVNNGVVSLYIDGVLAARNSTYGEWSLIIPNTFVAGAVAWDPTYTSANYAGDLDDVRLIGRALPPRVSSAEYWPDANTVVLWHLNENTGSTAADVATPDLDAANTGTITANTTWTSGRFGAGLNAVAGDSGYVSTTLSSGLFAAQQITMDAWIRPTAIDDGGSYIMGFDNGAGGDPFSFIRLGAGTYGGVGFKVTSGGTQWAQVNPSFGTNVLDGNWHHVAGTFSNGVVRMYLDGVLIGIDSTYAGASLAGTPGRFVVAGSVPWDFGYTGANYIGDIDEVRLSNVARTDFGPASTPPPPSAEYWPDASTVLLWHLNENTGLTAADAATPDLDGANAGTVVANDTWTTGRFGSGLNSVTNGTGYVSALLGSGLFSKEATMEAWIRPTAIDAGASYVMGWSGGGASFIRLYGSSLGVGFQVTDGGSVNWAEGYFVLPVNLADGNWRHIAGTFSNGVIKFYLNGTLIGSTDTGYGAGWTLAQPTSFAAGGGPSWAPGGGNRFIGDIDEVRLSNKARTDFGPASTLYSADGRTVLLWHMNEGSGTTAADSASILGGANNGTITANTTWTTGRFGTGLNGVTGDSGYVSTTLSSGLFTNQQITMEAWIKPTAIDDGGSYVMGYDNGSGGGPFSFIRLSSGTSGGVGFQVKLNTTTMYAQVNPSFGAVNVLDGNWHHIAGTLNDGVVCMYVDGVLVGTDSTYAGWTLPGEPVRFGVAGSVPWDFGYTGVNYIGDIDEVRLSNMARTNFMVANDNHPPVAKAITNGAPAGVTSTIRIIGGKPALAPTDADGDALLVSYVQNPSALLGATVTTDGTNILYTPGLNASGADTVQYVVSDGYGGYGTNTMSVTVSGQSFNIVSGPTLVNNQLQVSFAGIPNTVYAVDDSTNSVSGPWAFYTNLTAGSNGLFQLVATNDPPAGQRYFRTRPAP